jgi:hypothetical protein
VVRARTDGTIDRQPVGALGTERTANLAIEQFTQRDESVAERPVPVTTWAAAVDTGAKSGYAADDA